MQDIRDHECTYLTNCATVAGRTSALEAVLSRVFALAAVFARVLLAIVDVFERA